jgi:hypothetical protein
MNSEAIALDREAVVAAITRERGEYERLGSVRKWLEGNRMERDIFLLLIRALDERRQHRLERVFRLVGLIYSPHDVYSVYYNCKLKPALRPAAIEFLDNILEADLKETVVPLLEEAFEPEKALDVPQPIQFISIAGALSMLVTGDDPWLRTIASEIEKPSGEESDEAGNRRVNTH